MIQLRFPVLYRALSFFFDIIFGCNQSQLGCDREEADRYVYGLVDLLGIAHLLSHFRLLSLHCEKADGTYLHHLPNGKFFQFLYEFIVIYLSLLHFFLEFTNAPLS